MSGANHIERQGELLAERALYGLPAPLEAELEDLRRHHPVEDEDSYDLAAAALHMALLSSSIEPLPDRLRHRIESEATARLDSDENSNPQPAED